MRAITHFRAWLGPWVAILAALAIAGGASAGGAAPSALDFGNVSLGSAKTLSSTVTIDAGYTFGGAAAGTGVNPPFSFSSGGCAGVLGPATCTVQETFTPTATGPATGSVTPLECPTGDGSCVGSTIDLQGTGTPGAAANPTAINFGTVILGSSEILTSTLTIDPGYSYGGATGASGLNSPFSFNDGTCNLHVVGPATCTVRETFTPVGAGTVGGTISPSECPTGGGPCVSIPISLQGTGAPATGANPSTLDYGTVAVGSSKTLTSTITIDAGYTFGGATGVSGLNPPFSFSGGTCDGVVGPATCTIRETFTPLDVGPVTASLVPFECPLAGGQCVGPTISLQANVVPFASTIGLTSSANPSGSSVTFTAAIGGAPGVNAPTGTVTFTDGSTALGVVPVGGGTASFTTSSLAGGVHTITATYSGDANYRSSSTTITQVVPRASSTTLRSSPALSFATQTVVLTATVSGTGNPTGSVTFSNGATTLGTATLVNGRTTLSTSTLPAGVDQITATYSGDASFASSKGTTTQYVLPIRTFTQLDSSRTSSSVGQAVTFTASVVHAFGSTPSTGTVTFSDDGTTLGTVALAGGRASFTTSSLSAGLHTITASYADDRYYSPSSDRTAQQVLSGRSHR